jgi:hypothetical protein
MKSPRAGFPSDDLAKVPRLVQGDATRFPTAFSSTSRGQNGRRQRSRFRYFDFYESVKLTRNLHGTSFCWRKIVRKHRGML